MVRITEAFIKSLTTEKRTIISDDVVSGFAVRADPSGKKTYIYRYRIGGRQTTYTIGPCHAFSPNQAREEAKKLAGQVAGGIDPNDRKKALRSMPQFKVYASVYIEAAGDKPSLKDDVSKLDRVLIPKWGHRTLDGIKPTDVRNLLVALEKSGLKPATVNRYRSLICAIFNSAIRDGIVPENPASNIKPRPELNERTRWLRDDELGRFLVALDLEPENARNCILLMLLCGIRRGNVLSMRWDQLQELDGDRLIWTIPRTKTGKSQVVQLSADAAAVVKVQSKFREVGNPHVFPGRRAGSHIVTVQQAFARVIESAGIEDFHVHDLRHTFASHAITNGVPIFAVSKMLGHSSTKMTERYSHLQDSSLQEAAERATGSILNKGNK